MVITKDFGLVKESEAGFVHMIFVQEQWAPVGFPIWVSRDWMGDECERHNLSADEEWNVNINPEQARELAAALIAAADYVEAQPAASDGDPTPAEV